MESLDIDSWKVLMKVLIDSWKFSMKDIPTKYLADILNCNEDQFLCENILFVLKDFDTTLAYIKELLLWTMDI